MKRLTALAVLLGVLAARAMQVTTEKDFVRPPDEAWPMVEVLGVRLLWADAEALNRVLAPLLAPA